MSEGWESSSGTSSFGSVGSQWQPTDAACAREEQRSMSKSDQHLIDTFLLEPTRESFFQDEEESNDDNSRMTSHTASTTPDERAKRSVRQQLILSAQSLVERTESLVEPSFWLQLPSPPKRPDISFGDDDNKLSEVTASPIVPSKSVSVSGPLHLDATEDNDDQQSTAPVDKIIRHIMFSCGVPGDDEAPDMWRPPPPRTGAMKITALAGASADRRTSSHDHGNDTIRLARSYKQIAANRGVYKFSDGERRLRRSLWAAVVFTIITAITSSVCVIIMSRTQNWIFQSSPSPPPSMQPSPIAPPQYETADEIVADRPVRIPTRGSTTGPTTPTPTFPTPDGPRSSAPLSALPTHEPPSSPSMRPTASYRDYVTRLVLDRSDDNIDWLDDSDSLHWIAVDWLVEDPSFLDYSAGRLVQRYALALFYLQGSQTGNTHGSLDFRVPFGAEGMNGWMTYTDECTWFSTAHTVGDDSTTMCDSDGHIVMIHLEDVNLGGTLSSSLWLLSARLEDLRLGKNRLESSIPSNVALLSNLVHLDLHSNRLSGVIPASVGTMDKLESLVLFGNDLDGALPPELARLTNLESLMLERNELVGIVPSEYSQLTSLKHLQLYKNNIVGEIPRAFCNMTSIVELSADCGEVLCECCTYCCYQCRPEEAAVEVADVLPTIVTSRTVSPSSPSAVGGGR